MLCSLSRQITLLSYRPLKTQILAVKLHLELMDILWFTSSGLAFLFPEKCFAKKHPASCCPQSLWILTAAWIIWVAMWVMNQLKSHHIERLWVTRSSPSDPKPSLRASPKWAFHLLFRNQNEACCRHRGALKNCTACKRGFAILKPNNSAVLFQAYLHTALTYSDCARRERTSFTAALFDAHEIVWNSV